MFDISRIAEAIGSLFGGQSVAETLAGGNLTEMLANAGVDPSILDGLTTAEMTDLLAQNGIDLSQFSETQVADLFSTFGGGEQVQSLLDGFGFDEGRDRG